MELFIEQFPIVIHSLNIGFHPDIKAVFCNPSGSDPAGASDRVRIHVQVPAGQLSDEDHRMDHQGNSPDDSASDYLLFPGAGAQRNPLGRRGSDRFLAASIGFIFNYACYFSEIYRGGIQGVPHGQEEAGLGAWHDEEPDLSSGLRCFR